MLRFELPEEQAPIIKVIGIGGGGTNAVTHMFQQGIKGVDFYVCNTDAQSLNRSDVPNKIKLGSTGLGAGSNPSVGRDAALQLADEIRGIISQNTSMLFITAGMGGGTGTGAAPVIASIARELGILTVGIITKPFGFEGRKREQQALMGIEELKKYVDTTLVICNDKLLDMQGDLKLSQAFFKADDVLTIAAKGIAEIITVTGRINVDFEDVKTVMKGSGKAIMGSGMASGPERAIKAVEMALNSPLLDDTDIKGADNVLLYITSGKNEISLEELNDITGYITSKTGDNANVIWGDGVDENIEEEISITLIATGFDKPVIKKHQLDSVNINTYQAPEPTVPKYESISEIQLVDRHTQPVAEKHPDLQMPELRVNDTPANLFSNPGQVSQNIQKNKKEEPVDETADIESFFRPEPELEIVIPITLLESQEQSVSTNAKVSNPELNKEEQQNDRRNKLKSLSYRSNNPSNIEELERVPAYERQNVILQDINQIDEKAISRFTINTDEQNHTGIRENNSYLHDAAD